MSPKVVSDPDSNSRLALCAKRDKLKQAFLTVLEKRDFLQTTPNIDIFYIFGKIFFSMNKNSRSLPQNEFLFGSDLLAKFDTFAQKNVLTI